jgi:hypothetical protein
MSVPIFYHFLDKNSHSVYELDSDMRGNGFGEVPPDRMKELGLEALFAAVASPIPATVAETVKTFKVLRNEISLTDLAKYAEEINDPDVPKIRAVFPAFKTA